MHARGKTEGEFEPTHRVQPSLGQLLHGGLGSLPSLVPGAVHGVRGRGCSGPSKLCQLALQLLLKHGVLVLCGLPVCLRPLQARNTVL